MNYLLNKNIINLFLISFLMLFFELACIRWFGATVIFLTFFTNILLMACFLGISIGYLTASSKRDYRFSIIPFTLLAVSFACIFYKIYGHLGGLGIDVGNQSSPHVVYFGTEPNFSDVAHWFIPIWAVAAVFFALICWIFIGIGQIAGQAFSNINNRIEAYTINIIGSLAGIIAFSGLSYLSAPAVVWFLIALSICLYFVRKSLSMRIGLALMLILFLVTFGTTYGHELPKRESWSPYYKIIYTPNVGSIAVNDIGHQSMAPIHSTSSAYSLPYFLMRDAGQEPVQDILIIGAGSGNDVAAALWHGDDQTRIDAVEIDPKIYAIGKADHPDAPYKDTRVRVYLDDGRGFLRKDPDKKYDLIVYALVDSLALHSGYSSLRLESYLFTKEAFEDARKKLKPDGVFVMCNYYRQGWIVGRLVKMAKQVFGSEPIIFSLPFQDEVQLSKPTDAFNILIAGNNKANARIRAIMEAFQKNNVFWLNSNPEKNLLINGYSSATPIGEQWNRIQPARIDVSSIQEVPTDNWPFLYLHQRSIPFKPTLQGMLVIGLISFLFLFSFARPRISLFNWQMFFLGAGFMLLETKSVVHMALLFGSTWIVNSIVFAAILIMILLANILVLKIKIEKTLGFYFLLIIALLVNAVVPMTYFLSLPDIVRPFISCVVVFIPIFFAGVIFSIAFSKSKNPSLDLGANVAGIILGGLSENFSLVLGFDYLLFVAIIFYILSAALKPRLT